MKIGCVILAGGKSSRMGQDKALLSFNGKTFIHHLVEILDSFEEKMIARASNEPIYFPNWQLIQDLYVDHGPMGGIHSALSHSQSDALFVISCDTPFVDEATIETLVQSLQPSVDAVVSMDENGKVHPLCALYKKTTLPVFEKQLASNQNRLMAALNALNVRYVTITNKEALFNINTQEEYACILKK